MSERPYPGDVFIRRGSGERMFVVGTGPLGVLLGPCATPLQIPVTSYAELADAFDPEDER